MNIDLRISIESCFVFFASIFLIATMSPFYIWGNIGAVYSISGAMLFSCAMLAKNIFSRKKLFLVIFLALVSFLYALRLGASYFGAIYILFGVALISFLNERNLLRVFFGFKLAYAVILFPGLIIWVFHLLFGKDLLYMGAIDQNIIPNQLKADAGEGYAIYPFAIVLDYMLNYPVYRFMGPFDEPGRVGTISALILVANKMQLKKFQDWVIFLSGAVSLSLAFYLLILIYFLVMSFVRVRKIFFLVLFIGAVFFIASHNDYIKSVTLDRIVIVDGRMIGDNRVNSDLEVGFSLWKSSLSNIFFGIQNYEATGSSGWKDVLVRVGVLGGGVLILVFFLLYKSASNKNNDSVQLFAFLVVFVASFYQRPDVFNGLSIMIFTAAIVMGRKT